MFPRQAQVDILVNNISLCYWFSPEGTSVEEAFERSLEATLQSCNNVLSRKDGFPLSVREAEEYRDLLSLVIDTMLEFDSHSVGNLKEYVLSQVKEKVGQS